MFQLRLHDRFLTACSVSWSGDVVVERYRGQKDSHISATKNFGMLRLTSLKLSTTICFLLNPNLINMAEQAPTIDRLLQLVPDSPDTVLSLLRNHPQLASKQDAHGYSLVHAATSWDQLDLLKALIQEFNVDSNIKDEFGETCLFNAESVDFVKELLNLGVKIDTVNNEGQTAADYLDDEDEAPQVAAYLRQAMAEQMAGNALGSAGQPDTSSDAVARNDMLTNGTPPPPPLPNGVQVNIGTMQANEIGDEPDPEFRRRIEELAARQDFEGEDGQRELRSLVEDALSGVGGGGQGAASRRRVE